MKHMQRYLVLSGSDFEVFRPIGVTRCTYGVTFDMERSTEVSTPNITTISAGVGKWSRKTPRKFNQIFTKFCHINASHWRILCTIFTKFSGIVGIFLLGHMLKFGEIQLRGSRFQSHGSFNLRGSGYPQIFSAS